MWVRIFSRWAVIMDHTVPATHLSLHRPASAMPPPATGTPVGAWSAPPSAGVAGVQPASGGPPGDAGPSFQRVAGESGIQGPFRPSGSTQPGPAISIFEPVARMGAGPTAGVLPSVDAGGAEDPDAECVFDEDGEDEPSAASSSAEIPDDAVVAKWTSFAPLAAPPSANARDAARRRIKKWSGGEDSAFALPRPDLCLFEPFEAFRKSSRASWESASVLASSSGAAGHAVLAAASGVEFMKSSVDSLITDADSEAYWRPFSDGLSKCLAPLNDAASILASSFNRGITAVRKGVVAASPASIRPLLESQPPRNGYFFGDPQQALTSAVHLQQMMSAQLAQASAAPRRLPPAFPRRGSARAAAPSRPAAPASSSASSASGKGKASGRPARGGKGGPRK